MAADTLMTEKVGQPWPFAFLFLVLVIAVWGLV